MKQSGKFGKAFVGIAIGASAWACFGGPAYAAASDEIVGYVKTAQPDATIWQDGKSIVAEPGTPLKRGSVIRTGKSGSIGFTFKDNTIMSIGADTEISVDDYVYEPGKGDLKLGATLSKGSLYYVSGVIAKLKPEAVAIKTPTGTIGVRGTRFLAYVEGPQDASASAGAPGASKAANPADRQAK